MNTPTEIPKPAVNAAASTTHKNLMTLPASVSEPDFSNNEAGRTFVIGLTSGNPATQQQELYEVQKWIRENTQAWQVNDNNVPRGAIYELGDNPLMKMDAASRQRMLCYVLSNSASLPLLFPGDERDKVFSGEFGRIPGIIILEDDIDTRESARGAEQSRKLLGVVVDLLRGQRRIAGGEKPRTDNDAAESESIIAQLRAEIAEAQQALAEQAIQIEALQAELRNARAALAQTAASPPVTDSVPVVDPPASVEAPAPTIEPSPAPAETDPKPAAKPAAPSKADLLAKVKKTGTP